MEKQDTSKLQASNPIIEYVAELALLGLYSIYNFQNDVNWTQIPVICPHQLKFVYPDLKKKLRVISERPVPEKKWFEHAHSS